ncbi:hypothetical protein [Schinkia azotoformans]|uniref:hypothetical protein n=1 Tax=Schinkia azotoformans TaxID=1454 RepID=UPI002DBCC3AB|nr:hypothetical protein [Schinkia azotoformans]MEC1759852.1 hypothetical protein [Schinkia azotoformans]
MKIKKLVDLFRQSPFFISKFDTYIENAINKAIWYAIKRSGNWMMEKGVYTKVYTPDPDRTVFIKFLSENLYNVLKLKNEIKDDVLKSYHLSAKGIGDDLYYLTESYYRKLGTYKGKHSMSDFITPRANEFLGSGQISKNLMYEHVVPKNLYIRELAQATKMSELKEERIYELLSIYYFVCTVTVEEDEILLSIKMDEEWDRKNPFHRYEKAGISFFRNIERYA